MQNHFKKGVSIAILLTSTFFLNAQCTKDVKSIYGKIIEIDTVDKLIDSRIFKDHGNSFYYGIFHVKIETYKSDTMLLGIVYHLRTDIERLKQNFNLKKDSVYNFSIVEFSPCKSDFPLLKGCTTSSNRECVYSRQEGQIPRKSYKKISRVIETTALFEDVWQKLREKYKGK